MRAPTSRKYVAEQGIVTPNLSGKLQFSWSHSSIFPLEKQLKNLNFHNLFTSKTPFGGYFQGSVYTHFHKILSLKCPLVATFNETYAPTSRKENV